MRYQFWALCFFALTAFTATAVQAETIVAPSGAVLNKATCKTNPNSCMAQAGEACKGSYQVIDSESHAGGALADWLPGPVTWYSMLYQCGPSDGTMPTFQFRGPEYRRPSTASCTIAGQSVYCWSR